VQVLTGRLAATVLALGVLPGCTADTVEPSEADSPTLRAPAAVPTEPAETAARWGNCLAAGSY
jgi:hypothetical protein